MYLMVCIQLSFPWFIFACTCLPSLLLELNQQHSLLKLVVSVILALEVVGLEAAKLC
jgi:hypothetical protein